MAAVEGKKEDRESRLQLAIANDDVDAVHNLIVEEPELLDRVSKGPFPNTPLHLAAAAGKTQVAMEMAILKPSFARELNPEGYSPMHLALQHEHYHSVRALMTLDPKLIRVRGRCGITPLHYIATKKGDNELELLAEFLLICKSSIEDLTSRCETVVHVAVKHHNLEAFKVLFGWLKRLNLTEILNWKDEGDETVLHIARSKNLTEIVQLLLTVCKDEGLEERPFVSCAETPIVRCAEVFSRKLTAFEKCAITAFEKCAKFFRVQNEATREVILVVSTLIVATTYQATLTPPGGYWQDSISNPTANSIVVTANSSSIAFGKPHQAGDIILSSWRLSLYFICNSMAFYASIATILASTLPLEATSIVYISIPFLCTAYFISLSIQIPIPNATAAISVGVLLEFSLLAALCFLLYMKIKHRGVKHMDGAVRRIPTFLQSKDRK